MRQLPRRGFTEFHLSVFDDQAAPPALAAEAVATALAEEISGRELLTFRERWHGPFEQRGEVLGRRTAVLSSHKVDCDHPVSYVDGGPGSPRGPVAAQLWAIVASSESDTTVTSVAVGPFGGRLLRSADLELLWLADINGGDSEGKLDAKPTVQAERMFSNADNALLELGFSFRDVARTWLYLRRILDWYDELNRVRTAFFDTLGIDGKAHPFPASTGIQGTCAGEECCMEVLALRSSNRQAARPLNRSSRQHESFCYGSAFSRGMTLRLDEAKTILVSGTASIGPDGRTLHEGNREAQIAETLLSIAALLETEGATLSDIAAGTLFYKDAAALEGYRNLIRLLGVVELPLVEVLADVCRPELLVEIEALALLER